MSNEELAPRPVGSRRARHLAGLRSHQPVLEMGRQAEKGAAMLAAASKTTRFSEAGDPENRLGPAHTHSWRSKVAGPC